MSNTFFPTIPGLSYSVGKKPKFNTTILTAASGREMRARATSSPIYNFSLSFEFLRDTFNFPELQQLASFFMSLYGMQNSFLFKDPDDNAANNTLFGVGDGTTTQFQLVRSFGGFTELVNNAVVISVSSSISYTVSSKGVVTFASAPATGVPLFWTGVYYFRCRFNSDGLSFEKFMNTLWSNKRCSFDGCLSNKFDTDGSYDFTTNLSNLTAQHWDYKWYDSTSSYATGDSNKAVSSVDLTGWTVNQDRAVVPFTAGTTNWPINSGSNTTVMWYRWNFTPTLNQDVLFSLSVLFQTDVWLNGLLIDTLSSGVNVVVIPKASLNMNANNVIAIRARSGILAYYSYSYLYPNDATYLKSTIHGTISALAPSATNHMNIEYDPAHAPFTLLGGSRTLVYPVDPTEPFRFIEFMRNDGAAPFGLDLKNVLISAQPNTVAANLNNF